jgi:hypothetical protein
VQSGFRIIKEDKDGSGGPTPPLLIRARSGHGDQHSVLNEALMLEVIESLSRVGSNRGRATTDSIGLRSGVESYIPVSLLSAYISYIRPA